MKVADTDCWPWTTSWQEGPLHAPLKPAKLKPELGVAVSVTEVPEGKVAEQVVGQLTPPGLLITVPVPAIAIANCAC